jgi:hypothetical protein
MRSSFFMSACSLAGGYPRLVGYPKIRP